MTKSKEPSEDTSETTTQIKTVFEDGYWWVVLPDNAFEESMEVIDGYPMYVKNTK